ncbi:MAG TPA: hypothetical protein VNX40_14510 [Mucilaginibacter sp.]|nr:hypothetical protein [Mucilaginibacter sp.]
MKKVVRQTPIVRATNPVKKAMNRLTLCGGFVVPAAGGTAVGAFSANRSERPTDPFRSLNVITIKKNAKKITGKKAIHGSAPEGCLSELLSAKQQMGVNKAPTRNNFFVFMILRFFVIEYTKSPHEKKKRLP